VLEQQFGRYGLRLYELARGIDNSERVPDRPTQSISVEDTFERDVPLAETGPMIRRLAEKLLSGSCRESRAARTVVLKLKTSEFKILTRSHTPQSPPTSCQEIDEYRTEAERTSGNGSAPTLPAGRCRIEQLS
jgi:DNA polymerase IV